MDAGDVNKVGLNARVPPEIKHYVLVERRDDTGWKPPVQVVAGLLALERLPEPTQREIAKMAMRALQHGGAWEAVLAEARGHRKAIDEKVHRKMVEASLPKIDAVLADLRRASG